MCKVVIISKISLTNIILKGGHPSLTLYFELVYYMQYNKKDQIQIRDNSQANWLTYISSRFS